MFDEARKGVRQSRLANACVYTQAVKNASLKQGDWLCVVGAGGGLGHLAGKFHPYLFIPVFCLGFY